ncbi:phospho-sugar mutase [[Clostridium] aminophilum]|uniref:phosphoglucomutase (alpha-D-glucose-1,6-bisphosphate-dependent) n=1 Tax=[Clostridium] aminophilum TaxID=1526 RepID=A0A1I6JM05_9FIRM|nr:phospho-sugar mutase [[Clostridium] aminophilum]SFR80008.1 phosphoglucomutase [[Clostridium] aminophilum]
MNAQERYAYWMEKLSDEDPMKRELEEIRGNAEEITDRFWREIAFGTAGLRGICGAGTNRMNVLTVGRATQGIADYILASGVDPRRGVAIAYDCRYHSREFSELAAEILAGNGIVSWLFPEMRPTPELSFAIRELGACSGINMTASHNPKEYNGYKVYWEDGAQVSGEISEGMSEKISRIDLFDSPRRMPLNEAIKSGIVHIIEEDMDRKYLNYVESMAQRPDKDLNKAVKAVYTPLNGAGSIPVMTVLRERGFSDVTIVPEQKDPDPEFTTVGYPNPEDPRGFEYAEKLGRTIGAELLIATDPDSDRMAVEIRNEDGDYVPLNGNQTGALLIYYMAQARKEQGRLTGREMMIKSIVTGDFGRAVCEDYGIQTFEALTGFKNICGRIPELEKKGYRYFFGYEESIGCAPGEKVRDKDGVCAAMLVMEMAAYYKKNGMTLEDVLNEMYGKYGYYAEKEVSIVRKGEEGNREIRGIMERFRTEAPDAFAGTAIRGKVDYLHGYKDIPATNAMKFILEDGSWFCVRPSGTEPKIKFYYYTKKNSAKESADAIAALSDAVAEWIG